LLIIQRLRATCSQAAARILLLMPLLWSHRAVAHAWGNSYSLPIPFSMYAYGAAAALVISFVLVGYFAQADVDTSTEAVSSPLQGFDATAHIKPSPIVAIFRAASVLGLGLTITIGLFGNPSPFANFSMTFFWVIFVLGFTYFTGLAGDLYSLINPWKVICEWAQRVWSTAFVARRPYPSWAGYWPAIVLYGVFIWIELFANTGPRSVAISLSAYTAMTLLGASIFGLQKWFHYGEFFSVFLRLISKLAPFEWVVVPGHTRLRLRRPFQALIRTSADHPTLPLFILFMLSSTAFDGAHETLPWVNIFWKLIFPRMVPLLKILGLRPFVVAPDLYYVWQWTMLALAPFVYYAIYRVFIWMTKLVTRSALSVGELACRFALSLIPIAFVYHVSHYFSLLLTEGPSIVAQISDPFGFGWNLFGTASKDLSIIPPAGVVWHTQVWLILVGHIISVYIAHAQALKVFPSRAQAVRSQLPMLVLMVILTSLGLWILSLPIAAGQVNSSFTLG
jgi:hypothetical protein